MPAGAWPPSSPSHRHPQRAACLAGQALTGWPGKTSKPVLWMFQSYNSSMLSRLSANGHEIARKAARARWKKDKKKT